MKATSAPAWVLGKHEDARDLVDAVAFWVWRIGEHISISGLEVLVGSGNTTFVVAEHDRLVIQIDTEDERLAHADNRFERYLVKRMLEQLAGENVAGLLERIAPPGFRKMLVASHTDAEPGLRGGELPPSRAPLRGSDDGQAMDERGEHLWSRFDLPIGPVPSQLRAKILWTAVEFHVSQLCDFIATLSPHGLLERLLSLHERVIHRGAWDRRLSTTRMACFGDVADIAAQVAHQMETQAREGPAVRFVIEAIAARPPSGIRPPTQEVVDRLVALASQVHSVGGVAEAVREGLDDARVSHLPSGRMGVGRDGAFFGSHEKYREAMLPGELRQAGEAFSAHWRTPEPSELTQRDAADLNAAAAAEWGQSFEAVITMFAVLADMAEEHAAVALPVNVALKELGRVLSPAQDEVADLLEHFTSSPRPGPLLGAPAGYAKGDVYPWRYGRRLGLLHRPIVKRPTPKGDELVLAPRLLLGTGWLMVHEIQDGRFRARSTEMQQVVTRIAQRADEAFNDDLARRLAALPHIAVRARVTAIGPLEIRRVDGGTLGDVDVLAADCRRRRLHVLDSKNLGMARTPIEVASELKNTFRDRADGRPGKASIHAERVEWIQRHLDATLEMLEIDDSAGWTVCGALVTGVQARGQFVDDLPMPVIEVGRLVDWINRD